MVLEIFIFLGRKILKKTAAVCATLSSAWFGDSRLAVCGFIGRGSNGQGRDLALSVHSEGAHFVRRSWRRIVHTGHACMRGVCEVGYRPLL